MIVAFLYFLIDVVIICAVAWALCALVSWAPVIPAPVKSILTTLVWVISFILIVLGLIGIVSSLPYTNYYPFLGPVRR